MNSCPSEQQLNDLVAGTLADPVADSITEHLDSCNSCQERMQSIAAGELAMDSLLVESVAAAPPENSAYWQVRESFAAKASADASKMEHPSTGDIAETRLRSPGARVTPSFHHGTENELFFLEPSDDPSYIGRLQQFEISEVIGRGGMGVVLKAYDPHLQRSVAIKVLHAKFQQDPSAIERFCREGRAAAAVSHEHVVQMHQVARIEEDEIAFLIMQLIDGKTLGDCLEEQSPMAPHEVARIGMQIAAGLSAAHEQNLVHRDIKPGNILIEKSTGRVKLTDFGLARISDEVNLTRTGMLLGTALYMSPEQAMGELIDERSDLFSLGAVMYEMATGKVAFHAPTSIGVMKMIMDNKPAAPYEINPAIGKPTSDLIMQMLSKEPDKRPDSASDVARALASIVTEYGPISPLQVPAVSRSEVKRLSKETSVASRSMAIGGWLLASALLIGLAITFLTGNSPWSGNYSPRAGVASSPSAFAAEGTVVLNSSTGNRKEVTGSFSSVVLGENPGPVWSIDLANDGKTLAAGIGDGSVRLWDIDKEEVVRSFNAHIGNVWNVKFHPTLELFATAGDDTWVKLWDLKTFDLKQGWKLDNTVRAIAFAPDGKTLAAGDRDGGLHIYDVKTGQEIREIELENTTILGIDYSSDGKLLATVGSDKAVRVFDSGTLEQRQSFTGHKGPIYSVSFAPNSPMLASVGFKSDTWIWNADTGENVLQIEGQGGDNWAVGFCAEGQHLITGGQDGTAKLWSLEDGSLAATLYGHTAAVHDIALDHERKRIATSSRDGTIRVWDASALKALTD